MRRKRSKLRLLCRRRVVSTQEYKSEEAYCKRLWGIISTPNP